MITEVIVTDRDSSKAVRAELIAQGKNCAWISISDSPSEAVLRASNKNCLAIFFHDTRHRAEKNAITKNQGRKLKNFIHNHHKNMNGDFVLVVNCRAGISRSTAVGKYCELVLGIPTRYTELEAKRMISPNTLVLSRMGATSRKLGRSLEELTELHPEFDLLFKDLYDEYPEERGYV